MDASTSAKLGLLDRSINELNRSSFLEDMQIGADAIFAVEEWVKSMKPLLKYVTGPSNVYHDCRGSSAKVVFVAQVRGCQHHLYLDEAGSFVSTLLCSCKQVSCTHYRTMVDYGCFPVDISVSFLFAKLNEIMKQAEEKKEKHLALVREAREKLDKIMEVIRS
ncbi:MAG: hypothetical protein Q8Q90_03135 [bacterium]|nr:hypothetical protein [bacterium]